MGASTIKAANNPNTPYGANIIIISIIFKTTSLKESKKSLIGFALLGGIKIIEIPNNIEKNITCNMFLLSDAAATKLDGTKSTRGCNGPASLLSAAAFLFFSASESYCPISSVRVFSVMESPGFTILTSNKPTETAITVVVRYVVIVIVPIEDNFDISFKSETPLIKEARISGIAINFNELIKIVPNGLIQFEIKTPPPFTVLIIKPKRTPRAIPIKIFQCNDIFFIIFLNY